MVPSRATRGASPDRPCVQIDFVSALAKPSGGTQLDPTADAVPEAVRVEQLEVHKVIQSIEELWFGVVRLPERQR